MLQPFFEEAEIGDENREAKDGFQMQKRRKIVERLLEESTPHFLLKYKGFKGQALCRFTILLHEVMIMDKCKAFAH
jgi:hypothetical protein